MPRFKLIQGDCLVEMKNIPESSVDMVLADPPYGTTACKWDTIIPLQPMWEQLNRIIKPNGAIVMTASQPFTTILISSNMKMFKYCWVWEKDKPSNFALAKKQPMKYHEDVVVFHSGVYYPIMWEGDKPVNKSAKYGRTGTEITSGGLINNKQAGGNKKRYPKSIYKCNVVNNQTREKTNHPTQKPVALGQYLIRTYTNKGETILDFTAGSGSFGVSAIREGRNFIGIEKDENYFTIMYDRIKKELQSNKD